MFAHHRTAMLFASSDITAVALQIAELSGFGPQQLDSVEALPELVDRVEIGASAEDVELLFVLDGGVAESRLGLGAKGVKFLPGLVGRRKRVDVRVDAATHSADQVQLVVHGRESGLLASFWGPAGVLELGPEEL